MKPGDVLLERWEEVLARKGDSPAIFNTAAEVVRTFAQIDEHAREVESKMPEAGPHSLNAIQIGNHTNWPSFFLACLRTKRTVLPIDESVSKQHADAAVSFQANFRDNVGAPHGSLSQPTTARRLRSDL